MTTQAAGESMPDFAQLQANNPIWSMMGLLERAGQKNFSAGGIWEKCLCALIVTMKPKANVRQILESLPYRNSECLDESGTLNTMANLGFFARPATCRLADIDRRLLPCLLITDAGHPFIVLGQTAQGVLKFYDPVSLLVTEVLPEMNGPARFWFFQPYDENAASTSKFMRAGSGHTWFRALLLRFGGTVGQVMVAGLLLNMIALATPLFIMLVYNRVIATGTPNVLPMLTIGAILAIFLESAMRDIRSEGLSWLAGRLDNIVGNRIYAHLIGLAPGLIEKASVASQIARIKTFESVRDFFSGSVFLSLLELPYIIVSVLAIWAIAGQLVLVPLAMSVLYVVLFTVMRGKIKIAIRLAAKASSARQQFSIETFEKLDGIRAHGLAPKWQEKFRHLSGREMMAHFHLNYLGMLAETTAHALTVMAAVCTVSFGAHLIWSGAMGTGALVASMILVWRILTPFYSLCTMIPRLEQLRNSIIQVNQLMDIDTEAEEAKTASRLPRLKGRLSFDHVTLRYAEDSDPVFSNMSFDVESGEFIVVTGNNGTGKTTLLKLLKALYPPSEGSVRIDGFDLRQLDAPDLRRQIAYVPQHPDFFHGTITENLRISNPLASLDDIAKAISLADATQEIKALPQGLDTIIGAHGSKKLNASLAAKISLARAYLHPAGILLIDELPGTLLSGAAGENLRRYLERVHGKRTVVMTSYRQDILDRADMIVTLRGREAPIVHRHQTGKAIQSAGEAA